MVSVIIPNYNRADLIIRAVKSVLNQTIQDIEVIVVDDASTDSSVEVLNMIKDHRLHIVQLNYNAGACAARNKGISLATGEYIAFLDSDDEWFHDKLEKQIAFIEDSGTDACFAQYYLFPLNKGKHKAVLKPIIQVNSEKLYQSLLYENFIAMDTIIAKKYVFQDIVFDLNLPRYQDWDLALQIAKKYKIGFMPEPVLNVYEQKNSITNSTTKSKKRQALLYLYEKYLDDIETNTAAQSHFYWSIGLYSLFEDAYDYQYIQKAVDCDPKNLKKRITYILIRCGAGNLIRSTYGKKH